MAPDGGRHDGFPPEAGTTAIRLARQALDGLFPPGRGTRSGSPTVAAPADPFLDAPRGVFVTLRGYPGRDLRGCVGYPHAVYPLRTALVRAAAAAAVDDPRFPPVERAELDRLVVEVSLLTVPEPLDGGVRDRWPELIEVGRHGLIVEDGRHGGLLLPQVAPEQGWDARQLLAGTCAKAGLPSGAWRSPDVRVLTFEAIIFEEERPRGAVLRGTG